MKKITVIFVIGLFCVHVFSQDSKPTFKSALLIGGGVSGGWQLYNFNEGDGALSIIYFNFAPSLGYFIRDNLAIGISPSINLSAYNGYSQIGLGITPYIKNYFDNGFVIRGDAGYIFNLNSAHDNWNSYNSFLLGMGFGYALFINSKVSLEFFLNENFYMLTENRNDIYFQNNLYFSLGLQVFL